LKFKQKQIRCGQFKINLLEAGQVGAPVLFLIHDGALGGGAKVSWEGLIAELQSDFHIFAPDLYGFGESDMLFHFGLRPYQSHIEQVAALVEALRLEDVHFVGTSYGGSVLARAAAEASSPWPMRSSISISGAGGLFRHEEGKKLLAATEPRLESIRNCLQLLVSESWVGFDDNAEQRYQNSLRLGHWEALYSPRLRSPAQRAGVADSDSFPASLSHCDVPLLFIEGSQDPLLEKDWAARMAAHSPAGEAVRLEVSHSPNLDHPALVADVLRKFLRRHESASLSVQQMTAGPNTHSRADRAPPGSQQSSA
jgi:pimeloyl-ACP methyl ester carboxylesterase